MSILPKTPLTDDDGEVLELGDDFFDNAVRVGDFGSLEESQAFLRRREKLAILAEELGMTRAAWDALSPNKPGFEERFARSLDDAAAKARAVAETAQPVAAE